MWFNELINFRPYSQFLRWETNISKNLDQNALAARWIYNCPGPLFSRVYDVRAFCKIKMRNKLEPTLKVPDISFDSLMRNQVVTHNEENLETEPAQLKKTAV